MASGAVNIKFMVTGVKELNWRVCRVVSRCFEDAVDDKKAEINDIDDNIVRVQQSIHTLKSLLSVGFLCRQAVSGPRQVP